MLYIRRWPRRDTINTMPEETLQAFAKHGGSARFCRPTAATPRRCWPGSPAGIDVDELAADLQKEGAESFVKSWNELMAAITGKSDALKKAR